MSEGQPLTVGGFSGYCLRKNFFGFLGCYTFVARGFTKVLYKFRKVLYTARAMGREDKKLVNFRFGPATLEALEKLAVGTGASQTGAAGQAILDAAGRLGRENGETGLEFAGDAQTILRWWMRQDKVTEREVVEAALLVYDDFRQKASAGTLGTTPALGPMVSASPVVDNRPKNATCKHCGEMFAGARFATICPGCKSLGHTLMPAECPRCTEGISI